MAATSMEMSGATSERLTNIARPNQSLVIDGEVLGRYCREMHANEWKLMAACRLLNLLKQDRLKMVQAKYDAESNMCIQRIAKLKLDWYDVKKDVKRRAKEAGQGRKHIIWTIGFIKRAARNLQRCSCCTDAWEELPTERSDDHRGARTCA